MTIWQWIGVAMIASLPIGGFIWMWRASGLRVALEVYGLTIAICSFCILAILLAQGAIP